MINNRKAKMEALLRKLEEDRKEEIKEILYKLKEAQKEAVVKYEEIPNESPLRYYHEGIVVGFNRAINIIEELTGFITERLVKEDEVREEDDQEPEKKYKVFASEKPTESILDLSWFFTEKGYYTDEENAASAALKWVEGRFSRPHKGLTKAWVVGSEGPITMFWLDFEGNVQQLDMRKKVITGDSSNG